MNQLQTVDRQSLKSLLKAAWAVSAPSVVPFVLLVSFNAVDLLAWTGLGRLGIAAVFVLFMCFAFLFWKGRFWAAVPALLVLAGGFAAFIYKFYRPFMAYTKVNPINGIGDLMEIVMMLSPSLVVSLICLTLGMVVAKGIKISWRIGPQPVRRLLWGLVVLWAAALAGDAWYQGSGWRQFNLPSDLMVRMCQGDPKLRIEAQERLLNLGPAVVPDLLLGVSTPDPDLDCLRQNSSRVILAFGKEATKPLLNSAEAGDQGAVRLLGELGDKRALQPLREILQGLKPDSPKELKAGLEKAIAKLAGTGPGGAGS